MSDDSNNSLTGINLMSSYTGSPCACTNNPCPTCRPDSVRTYDYRGVQEPITGKFVEGGCVSAGKTIVHGSACKCDIVTGNIDADQYKALVFGKHLKEGAKFDDGKPRMDLLPSDPLKEVAKVLTFGAKKYAAHNWRKGINYSRVYAGIQRHLSSWNDNVTFDEDTKLNHLAHAACGIMFLLEYELKKEKYAEFDDRYKGDK